VAGVVVLAFADLRVEEVLDLDVEAHGGPVVACRGVPMNGTPRTPVGGSS
jgi:hypothetical protein